MGNLLKVLTCTDLEQGPNFFLDFESEKLILYIYYSLPAVDCICHVLNVCFHFAVLLTALHAWAMDNCLLNLCRKQSVLKQPPFPKCIYLREGFQNFIVGIWYGSCFKPKCCLILIKEFKFFEDYLKIIWKCKEIHGGRVKYEAWLSLHLQCATE